ncbi:hypothetical protein SAMN04490178_1211, partial [Propionispora vibrioides]
LVNCIMGIFKPIDWLVKQEHLNSILQNLLYEGESV